ncbi:unnamed protein product [Brachionus calyciflorus]|uniref:DUF4378 domain-containing protein n=1 Tax=Brachionus calyciflorus TaxID=104777 RepID=A0A813R5L7_9BILA|nr:unnamed protein product [Brachionus calyciflorus]
MSIRYLTEREKKLRLRRKHAEEIIAWKKKLDDEELKVREIEKQANQVLKEKPKQNSPKIKEKIKKEKTGKLEEKDELENEDEEEDIVTDIVKTESKLAPLSVTKTIATSINNNENNSYAESFESSIVSTVQDIKSRSLFNNNNNNKKINNDSQSNVILTSIQHSVPSQISEWSSKTENRDDDTTKDSSSTSISEPTATTASSNTSASVRELEIKVKELKNEYIKKRNEAEKLGKMLKEAEKMKMKEKEEQLRKKIESYDTKLEKIKTALNNKSEKQTKKVKQESKSEIKTEEIADYENSSVSSSSSNDAKTKSTSSLSTKQISTQKYDEEFESERPTTQTSTTTTTTTTTTSSKSSEEEEPSEKVESKKEESNNKMRKIEEDEKSTISDISEDLMGNSASQNNMKLDGLEDMEENSNSLNSSTDTQILILGSSRQANKESNGEKDQSLNEIEKFRKQDSAIQNFVKNYLSNLIDDMIEIRNVKSSKLLAEQYKETVERLNDDKESEEESDEENVKIPIPPIDLDQVFDDDNKAKNLNDTKNESLKPPVFNVPFSKEKVSILIDKAIEDYYWKNLNNLKNILEVNVNDDGNSLAKNSSLQEFFAPETESKEIEFNFKKMLLDLTGEFVYDLYLENYEKPELISEFLPGYHKPLKKKHFKSYFKGPASLDKVKELVRNKVLNYFKLDVNNNNELANKNRIKSKWRIQKKLDLVDGLLDVEMREQEHEWSNYEIEEYEAKLHISNSIFDMLLKDTIDCVQLALIKKK